MVLLHSTIYSVVGSDLIMHILLTVVCCCVKSEKGCAAKYPAHHREPKDRILVNIILVWFATAVVPNAKKTGPCLFFEADHA